MKPIVLYNSLISQKEDVFLKKSTPTEEGNLFRIVVYKRDTFAQISSSQTISPQFFAVFSGKESEIGKEEGIIKEYVVKEGDTLSGLAKRFHISVNTILWANNLSSRSILKPGQKLIILPVSGVLHMVKKGDTVSKLAKIYKVSKNDIIEINNLSADGKIYIGDLLIIPGAKPALLSEKKYPHIAQIPIASNYFICPILPPCRITQGLHWYNAVDFGHGVCGDPVLAAAGGVVQRTGYHRIAGNYIRILHPNGVVTFYGHLSKIIVSPGQKVSQGQIIGYIGHTGYTIPAGPHGCHLHFEVRGARNPFASY